MNSESLSTNSKCSICQQFPEDMLILSCNHNLCIDCATEVFALSAHGNIFVCQICQEETELDQDTTLCLRSLVAENHMQKVQINTPAHLATSQKWPPLPLPKTEHFLCPQHKQAALYYCFDCQNYTLCSQCILNSSHKEHNVQTIKKAVNILIEKILSKSKSLESLKESLTSQKQKIRQRKEELERSLGESQKNLKDMFDDVVRLVSIRYSELSAQLEQQYVRKIQIMSGSMQAVQDKCEKIEEAIKTQKSIASRNDFIGVFRYVSQMQYNDFQPELPTAYPSISMRLNGFQAYLREAKKMLEIIAWETNIEQSSRICKIIEGKGRLKEQKAQMLMGEQSAVQSKNVKNLGSRPSRKLQLSRSIDNAANLISKLQERVKLF